MSNSNPTLPADQISPKEIIIKLIEIKNILKKNWYLVVIFAVAGYGIGYLLDVLTKKPDTYTASITFNLGGSGGNSNSFGDLAASLGMAAGTPDANIFTGENFNYFVKSRPVLERTLMKEISLNGKKELLANFYIDSSAIKTDEWEDRDDLQNFKFSKSIPDSFDLESRQALNMLVLRIYTNTEVGPIDRKSSFISLSVNTENALLSKDLVENLLNTVEELYTENQTAKTRKIMTMYKKRADSLAFLLGKTETQLARTTDENLFVVEPEAKSQQVKLTRNSTFIQGLYTQALTNYESLRLTLIREAPLFTIIEPVLNPLDRKIEIAKKRIIGLFVGLLLSFLIIYIKTLYSKALSDQKA